MISESLPKYERIQIVNALQIRALDIRESGDVIILHFYETPVPQIFRSWMLLNVPSLHSYMVRDEDGHIKFIPEIEFNVAYRRVLLT